MGDTNNCPRCGGTNAADATPCDCGTRIGGSGAVNEPDHAAAPWFAMPAAVWVVLGSCLLVSVFFAMDAFQQSASGTVSWPFLLALGGAALVLGIVNRWPVANILRIAFGVGAAMDLVVIFLSATTKQPDRLVGALVRLGLTAGVLACTFSESFRDHFSNKQR